MALRREGWAKIRPDICMLSQTHYLLTLTSGVIPDWQCSLSLVAICFLSYHFFSRYEIKLNIVPFSAPASLP